MRSKPNIDSILEVFNKLPSSEKKRYSVLSQLCAGREIKENTEPIKELRRTHTHSLDLLHSMHFDEPVNDLDVFGEISEIEYHGLPINLEFTNRLFISDIKAANDLGLLRKFQVFSILSLGKSNKPLTYPSIRGGYRCVALEDNQDADILKEINNICSFIDIQLQKGNVLVHCLRGKSRSCAVVIAYLMKKFLIGYQDAERIVKDARPCCEISQNFVKQLNSTRWKDSYL